MVEPGRAVLGPGDAVLEPGDAVPDAVLSIQSRVAHGHVGNSAATLPLQRLGFDVVALDTVQLAHHPGYGTWRGHKVEPERLREILRGIEERGVLARTAAVLSGYLGDAAVGQLVLDAVAAVRKVREGALYVCDPVIGDDGKGVFVGAGIPELFRERLVPAADVVLPNRFELAMLSGREVGTLDEARQAAVALRALGPRLVVATGLPVDGRPDQIAMLADAADEGWLTTVPRRPLAIGGGCGDVFSALLVGHLLREGSLGRALERATAAISAVVERTVALGTEELALVAAQDAMLRPPDLPPARRLVT